MLTISILHSSKWLQSFNSMAKNEGSIWEQDYQSQYAFSETVHAVIHPVSQNGHPLHPAHEAFFQLISDCSASACKALAASVQMTHGLLAVACLLLHHKAEQHSQFTTPLSSALGTRGRKASSTRPPP